ncbi:MAG: hypothetical protein M5U01_21900 [Ardenticatenaceae bacterium]|nr:hypothetical protein [Ardenticatenaceae bacterium]
MSRTKGAGDRFKSLDTPVEQFRPEEVGGLLFNTKNQGPHQVMV